MSRILDFDLVAVIKEWAWIDPDLVTHFGDTPMRVASKLDPTKSAVLPAARLQRITTTEPVHNHLTGPVVEVSVWAQTPEDSFDAAAALRARMHDGGIIGKSTYGVITGLETAQGIRLLEDPDAPQLSRHLFATRYYCHPSPA